MIDSVVHLWLQRRLCLFCHCHSLPLATESFCVFLMNRRKTEQATNWQFFNSWLTMAAQERTRREEASQPKDWLWSVQPLVNWLKWIGIDLNSHNAVWRKWWFALYRIVCPLMFLSGEVYCLHEVLTNFKQFSIVYITDGFNSDAFAWNVAIDYTNFAIHCTGSHLVLLFVVRTRWCSLEKTFQRLQSFLDIDFFTRIRRASILSLIYVIVAVCIIEVFEVDIDL